MLDAFERFKKMKLSEVVEGRKQDLLTWIHGHPQIPVTDEEAATTSKKFSFNSALLSPYFATIARDNTTLPFIEFPTIGLLKAPQQSVPNKENALGLIEKFLDKAPPYQNVDGNYFGLPFIIQMNNRYFLYGNTKGNQWAITELDATLISSHRLPFTSGVYPLPYNLQHFPIYHHIIEKKGHTHFSTQPQQVLRLKKIINSTFYIKALLKEAEGIEFSLSGLWRAFGSGWNLFVTGTTYTNIYRAITLLFETELDVTHRFKEEIGEFLHVLERFKQYSTWKKEKLSEFQILLDKFKKYTRLNAQERTDFLGMLQKFQHETSLSPEEIAELQKVIEHFASTEQMDVANTHVCLGVLETFQRYLMGGYKPSWSFQAGHAAGFAVRHIYEPNGQWDVDVFSQFSADLPRHLDMLTTLINSNHSSITQYAPHINPEQLRSLQKEATQLLKTLKETKRLANSSSFNPLYQMYKIINYAFLIQKILGLMSTTLTQVGQLNDAYQEALRDILTLLKEECIPLLWKYAVHMEVESIADPGTITMPVLEYIKSYYALLTDNIKNLGDFTFLGEHLLIVEDSKFIQQCDDSVQTMWQESELTKKQIVWAQQAADLFFKQWKEGIRNPTQLQTHYAWLTSYVAQFDSQIDTLFVQELKNTAASFNPPAETMRYLRSRLTAHLEKLYNTEELRAKQCQTIRAAIPKQTNLQLFPYHDRMGCDIALKIVEGIPLNQLKLLNDYPILIQHRFGSETSYVFWGNTNGIKWGFTPIGEAFLHRGILNHFATIRSQMQRSSEDDRIHVLPYKTKYESLYLQMILKKAHTYYRSPFCSFESEALEDKQESLTKRAFKPIDWLEKQWHKQQNPVVPAQPNSTELNHKPVAVLINPFHDHYPDLKQLSAEQAFKLYNEYQQKITAYHEAQRNISHLKKILVQPFQRKSIEFSAEQSELQKECLYLYHSIRPYYVNMDNFSAFDHKMLRVFSGQSSIPYTEFMHKLGSVSLRHEQRVVDAWKNRSEELLEYAYKNMQSKQEQILLNKSTLIEPDPRAGYLLKTKQLSTKIQEFHASLQTWTRVLNPVIRGYLTPQRVGIPYPDILDLNTREEHVPFVLFFKRTFNAIYYLEKLVDGLETIRTGDSEEIKNETIALLKDLGQTHGLGLLDIGLQLSQDPILREICTDIYQQYSNIVDSVSNIIQPHTADVKKVNPQHTEVSYSGLWRAMNSFYTFPEQLLNLTAQDKGDHNFGYQISLQTETSASSATWTPPRIPRLILVKNENQFSDNQYRIYCNGRGNDWKLRKVPVELINSLDIDFNEDTLDYDRHYQPLYDYLIQNKYHLSSLNKVQIEAKRATENIECIIRDSNHYFKLFLFDGPMIYQLNQSLQKQAQLFTRTTQEVALSHLQILENDYFSVLMAKADTKEHEWGLDAGTLTEPLLAILKESFHGLIFPLKMTFLEKEALCTSDALLKARIKAEEKRFRTLSAPDEALNGDLDLFHEFTQNLNVFEIQYKAAYAWNKPPLPVGLAQSYKDRIYHKLNQYRLSFIPDWIKTIPLGLDRTSLKAIHAQVTQYHLELSRLALLHNAEQKQLCEALPIFLKQLKALERSAVTETPSAELITQYTRDILPKLKEKQISYFPDWLTDINMVLTEQSTDAILQQSHTYYAHLKGLQNTRHDYRNFSQQKLIYLNQKLNEHTSTSRQQYRQLFAKHHFHTYINRLPYQSVGIIDGKIRREYQRELAKYLINYESDCLDNIETQDHLDAAIEQKLKVKITEFKQDYYERFYRLDRVKTAINEFKDYLRRDRHIPARLRANKLDCLNAMEDIIQQNAEENTVDEFLNQRGQLLQQMIRSSTSEKILLEQHKQFYTLWDWLIDCIFSFLESIGLYTPEQQRCYSNLCKATEPEPTRPTGWTRFLIFPSLTSTPPRRAEVATPGATPIRPPGR